MGVKAKSESMGVEVGYDQKTVFYDHILTSQSRNENHTKEELKIQTFLINQKTLKDDHGI